MEDNLWVGNFCAISELKENRHSYDPDLIKCVCVCVYLWKKTLLLLLELQIPKEYEKELISN